MEVVSRGRIEYALKKKKRFTLPLKVLRPGCRNLGQKKKDPGGGCCNNSVRNDGNLNLEIMMKRVRSG